MKNLNELPEILEVSDLMEFFGLSRAGTYRLVRKKGFPAFKLLGRYTIHGLNVKNVKRKCAD